jgi:23S rRNA pseudouridine2605 synthase
MEASKKRLSKTLAAAGVASRRACETLIFDGHVKVNGVVTLIPQTLVDEKDKITVKGTPVSLAEPKVYYILNKPVGYVCSTKGGKDTRLIYDLFADVDYRLFTVGRLDKETSGLIIVTNDGHFANRVIHPSSDIHKDYVAKTDTEITAEHLIAIGNGTQVEGVFVKPVKVSKVRKGTIKITIAEGKKREVRRLLESVRLNVLELSRIRIGNLTLGNLPVGSWREMTEREKELIFE